MKLIDLQQSLSTTSISNRNRVPHDMSEYRDLQDSRQKVLHSMPKLGVPDCDVDTPDEGDRNEGISHRGHHWDVLSTEGDNWSREARRGVGDHSPQAVLPADVRDNTQGGQIYSSHEQRAHDYPRKAMEELGSGILCAVWGGEQRCGWKLYMVEVCEGMIDRVG